MPVHDWARVNKGVFQDFQLSWIVELQRALNAGLLSPEYYALIELRAAEFQLDFELRDNVGGDEMEFYLRKQNRIVIRHSGGDDVIALIEVVSPGNKASRWMLDTFIEKAAETLDRGFHLMLLDLHPPTARDPQGIHGALWSAVEDDSYAQPTDKPLTTAAYCSDTITTAYVEPLAVGDALTDMPLFLTPATYVPVPLEQTYRDAFESVPLRWRRELEPIGQKSAQ